MKVKKIKALFSVILVITVCVTTMLPASAGRVTSYLSELQMAEAATEAEAKQLLTEEGFTVLDKNLNPGGSKAVYLGYKKSTNVEDAITDVRVMNMNGGFNISDYETIVEDALAEYSSEVNNIRIAAKEFAENYKAGKKEAQLAYRQLNYYYVESKEGEKTYMGDYMLSFPEKNEGFADILLKGNTHILDNIRILLSMGVADGGNLIERIKTAVADESIYDKMQYHEKAKEMAEKIQQLQTMRINAQNEIDEINADNGMTAEEKELAALMPKYLVTLITSLDLVLQSIPCGESNYKEYFETAESIDYKLFYPFVEAMTEGQRAMAVSGQVHSVLVYNAVELSDEELAAQLAETEKNYEPVSVYLGTDMSLVNGAVGVTSAALVEESATGKRWFGCFTGNQAADISISSLLGAGGIALASISSYFLKQQYDIAHTVLEPLEEYTLKFNSNEIGVWEIKLRQGEVSQKAFEEHTRRFVEESNAINAKVTTSTTKIVLSSFGLAVGLAMIAFSIYSIVQIVDTYNPKYTKIPSNMVDTVATENGSRFINYKVVDALYKDGDNTKSKPGDTNAYDGKMWNAIYYTKNYEAGKCMTATGYFIDSESNFGKYTPVAKFSNKNCYDLNAHNDNDSVEKIYIAFGNSANKKAAQTSVPTVVGSMLTYGAIAISGVAGLGIGMAMMAAIKRKKYAEKA